MKGDKGTCLFFDEENNMVNKTKFDSRKNCDLRIQVLIGIGAYPISTVSYKCKKCGFWHPGKEEQAKKYSK